MIGIKSPFFSNNHYICSAKDKYAKPNNIKDYEFKIFIYRSRHGLILYLG